MTAPNKEFLEHHGIKGMHWGVRKAVDSGSGRSAKKTAKADKKWEKKASSSKSFFKTYNDAAHLMNNGEIDRINNMPRFKGKDLSKPGPLQKAYYSEYQKSFEKALNTASDANNGTNASGTKKVKYHYDFETDNITFSVDEVKHADGTPHFVGKVNDKGFIVSIKLVTPEDDAMAQAERSEAFLEHHGVKGMHWGVRRANKRLEKQSASLQSKSEHLRRLANNTPANRKEKLQRAAVDIGNFGLKKASTARLNELADEVDAKHKVVIDRLNTPAAERRMKGSTKAKIAVGSVVAARLLYVVGGTAINTLATNNRAAAAAKGIGALSSVASKTNYAKLAKGAYKITTKK